MNFYSRQFLPSFKLMLIWFIPLILLIFLSLQLYKEKREKLFLLESYIRHINQSENIAQLIAELQNEREYSYEFVLKKEWYKQVLLERHYSDSLINLIETSNKQELSGFRNYTFLEDLSNVRARIDSGQLMADGIMHYYTNIIFRLNTLNEISVASNIYVEPVYKDLIGQKLLSDMITYLGIIRSNIYNVLFSGQNMAGTLYGLLGVYDVYKTYEKEFLIKADDSSIQSYTYLRNNTPIKPTITYLDTAFKKFALDKTYDAQDWCTISARAIGKLKDLQTSLIHNVKENLDTIYKNEKSEKDTTLIFLSISILLVLILFIYTLRFISDMIPPSPKKV